MGSDRITLFANGKETLLCEWTDTVQAGRDVAPDHDVQVVKYFRGTNVSVFDRANQSNTLNFAVNRDFGDEVKAFDFWMNPRSVIPRFGDLTWKFRTRRGVITRSIKNCAVKLRPEPPVGVFVRIHFSIIGGAIVTTAPTA